MPQYFHIVAQTRSRERPLLYRDRCAELWERLRNRFAKAAACVLMPDHLHLVVAGRARDIRWELGVALRSWTRRCLADSRIWARTPSPDEIPDSLHLRRTIRYVHLNPCRSNLVDDPLKWEWSTHRDLLGAVVDPWCDEAALRAAFGRDVLASEAARAAAHRYISSDPSVKVIGSPPLQMYRPDLALAVDGDTLIRAASIATRTGSASTSDTRYLAAVVADRLGLRINPTELGLSRSSWYRALAAPTSAEAVAATLRTLSDSRCLASTRRDLSAVTQRLK